MAGREKMPQEIFHIELQVQGWMKNVQNLKGRFKDIISFLDINQSIFAMVYKKKKKIYKLLDRSDWIGLWTFLFFMKGFNARHKLNSILFVLFSVYEESWILICMNSY